MNYQRSFSYYSNRNIFQRLLAGIILLILVFVFFYVSWKIYQFLFILSPIFIILALVLNSSVVTKHIQNIFTRFKTNMFSGLLYLTMQVVGLPIVSIGLAFKAWALKKFGSTETHSHKTKSSNDDFTPYEEVIDEIPLDLEKKPKFEKLRREDNKQSQYDDMFV